MAKDLLAGYRSRFIQHMAGAMNNVVQACKVLVEAKDKLKKEEFERLATDLNLSKRDAEKYVRIGSDKRFDAEEVRDRLPHAWTVLDRISSLNDHQFKQAVKNGVIHPMITRAEIDAFKNGDSTPTHEEKINPNAVRVATIWIDKSMVDHTQVEAIMKMLSAKLIEIQTALSVQPLKLTDHGLVEKLKPSGKQTEKAALKQRKNEEKALRILGKAVKKTARLRAKGSKQNTSVHETEIDLSDEINCQPDLESVELAIVRLKINIDLKKCLAEPEFAQQYYDALIEKEKKGLPV